MANTAARTQTDVDEMTKKDRLWDSLNYSYGQKREDMQRQVNQSVSQTDRALLGRGMQRSSYGAQTLANQRTEGDKAIGNIWDAQIADYENRLTEQENTEWQQAFSEKQFNEGAREFDLSFGLQKDNADRSLAGGYVSSIIANGRMPSDDLLARAGLSREDAQRMIVQAAASGSSGGGGGSTVPKPIKDTGDDKTGNDTPTDANYDALFNNAKDLSGTVRNNVASKKAVSQNAAEDTRLHLNAKTFTASSGTVQKQGLKLVPDKISKKDLLK